MAVNDELNDVIYETNKRGHRVLVRSLNSEHCVYIRFVNRVSRPVDVWWRDFQGKRRHYARMEPRAYFNIETYVTHPWEFTDPATNENYIVNNRIIFRPHRSLAGMRFRTNWIISARLRSLRKITMLALCKYISDASKVQELGLPQQLSADLENMIYSIQNTPPPPSRT